MLDLVAQSRAIVPLPAASPAHKVPVGVTHNDADLGRCGPSTTARIFSTPTDQSDGIIELGPFMI